MDTFAGPPMVEAGRGDHRERVGLVGDGRRAACVHRGQILSEVRSSSGLGVDVGRVEALRGQDDDPGERRRRGLDDPGVRLIGVIDLVLEGGLARTRRAEVMVARRRRLDDDGVQLIGGAVGVAHAHRGDRGCRAGEADEPHEEVLLQAANVPYPPWLRADQSDTDQPTCGELYQILNTSQHTVDNWPIIM